MNARAGVWAWRADCAERAKLRAQAACVLAPRAPIVPRTQAGRDALERARKRTGKR